MPKKRAKKKNTKKTKELVEQICLLRNRRRYDFTAIGRELGIGPPTAQKWYYEALGTIPTSELEHMRKEETLTMDRVISKAWSDLESFTPPAKPDLDHYAGHARVKAYEAGLTATNNYYSTRQKMLSTIVKASGKIQDLHNLSEVENTEPLQASIDDTITGLLQQMEQLDAEAAK